MAELLRKIGRIEILKDMDGYGHKRYTAVDPQGYIGRTRIAEHWDYRNILAAIRKYRAHHKGA